MFPLERGKDVLAIYREICEKNTWEKELGITRDQAYDMGYGVLGLIYEKRVKTSSFGRRRWKYVKSNRYGGTQMMNYRIEQDATYSGTPNLEQLWRIGS